MLMIYSLNIYKLFTRGFCLYFILSNSVMLITKHMYFLELLQKLNLKQCWITK